MISRKHLYRITVIVTLLVSVSALSGVAFWLARRRTTIHEPTGSWKPSLQDMSRRKVVVAALKAWESRFEMTKATFTALNPRENPNERKLISFSWPGKSQLWAGDSSRKLLIAAQEGRAFERPNDESPTVNWVFYQGTDLIGSIRSLAAAAEPVQYLLGAYLTLGLPMSAELQSASDFRIEADSPRRAVVRFVPPDHQFAPGVSIRIDVDLVVPQVTKIETIRDGKTLIRTEIGNAAACDEPWLPVKVVMSWPNARVQSRPATYMILNVDPLLAPPIDPVLVSTDKLLDVATGYTRTWSSGTPLDESRARLTLAGLYKRESLPSGGTVARTTTCGTDCLYYLLAISDHPTSSQRIMDQIPDQDAGSSLAQLQRAAAQCGLNTRATYDPGRDLGKTPMPAILAVSSSHFVLLCGVDQGVAWIIQPPYGVEKISLTELQASWSGYALTSQRQ